MPAMIPELAMILIPFVWAALTVIVLALCAAAARADGASGR
jgi:hypothetical protein